MLLALVAAVCLSAAVASAQSAATGTYQLCAQQGKTIFGSVAVPSSAEVCAVGPTSCQVGPLLGGSLAWFPIL